MVDLPSAADAGVEHLGRLAVSVHRVRIEQVPPVGREGQSALNMSHKRGAAKARLLLGLGYRFDAAHVLGSDLRAQHLALEVTRTHENPYGVVYEVEAPIKTPSGKSVRFCSVWQVDTGTEVPRFITMYPR